MNLGLTTGDAILPSVIPANAEIQRFQSCLLDPSAIPGLDPGFSGVTVQIRAILGPGLYQVGHGVPRSAVSLRNV